MTQCEFCGRVLIKRGVWARPTAEVVTFVGYCPRCAVWEKRKREQAEVQAVRQKLRANRGRTPRPDAVPWEELRRGK